LEDNAVLELRSLDLAKSDKETREPVLILRFGFPSPIRTGCVAFADSHELDILSVFVVTKTNNLYTFTLRPSFFCRAEASEDDSATWCKSFRPSPFTISAPHRLFATNPFELLAALGDGRLARLTRPTNGDGTDWDERTYNDGQWGTSLRGLIRWQGNNTIRHDGAMLETETALSTMESPDGKHIFAVCLNHTLRAWNKETGKLTLSRDLLDIQRGPQETAKMSLNPGLARVLSVFEVKDSKEGDLYYILTFSPHDNGIFKFWGIRDAEHADAGIRDLAPDYDFKVPDPNDGAPWTMADFKLKRSGGASRVGIWILMRLNRRYKLYHRIFDLNNLADEDESEWSVTMTDTSKAEPCCEPPIKVIDLDPEDNTDKWLMYLLSPGRFQGTVLETALSIYIQARDLTLIKNSKASLKERIGSYVGSHLKLRQMGTSTSSYKKFAEDVNAEWISFWTIVTDLDQHRKEPLGLGFDEDANMPWVVLGDGCSAIRECSEIELLAYNEAAQMPRDGGLLPSTELPDPGSDPKNADELAMLVEAAAKFRSTFSDTLQFSCKNVLTTELWQDSSLSITARIQTFYDQCNFADEIGDRQYNDLASSLRRIDGFDGLNTSMFYGILQTLPQYRSSEASGLLSTRFGLRVLVNGAQDMVALHTRILTDLLLLLVFVDADVDRDECPMDSLDTPRVFVELLDQLKQNETALWLATSIRPDPTNTQQNQTQLKPTAGAQPVTSTLLENMFAVYLPPQSYIKYSQHAPLTNNMRDLLKWVTGGNNPEMSLDQILVHIQCNLLKNNNLDLATLFLQYQPSTAWAAYVRGRLYLLHGTHNVAATHFQKAAFKLCEPPWSLPCLPPITNTLSQPGQTPLSNTLPHPLPS
jgi:nuclear pore complex protein Nup160